MSRPIRLSVVLLAVLFGSQAIAKSPFSLITFRKSKDVAKSSQLLTEENGPWMIFVAAFAGEGAETEARELVEQLRSKFKMNAYLHKKQYDYTQEVKGKGFDKFGNPKRMRFNSDLAFEEVAVLVGDFQSLDDPQLQEQMKTIKYATASELALRGSSADSPTTRRFAGIRSAIQKKLSGASETRRKGPMRNAFATRNPMVPREATAPKGLDPMLIEWNKGVKYSLLDNPGKYTVRVASFRGQVVIDQKKIHQIESNQLDTEGRIDSTDEKAEALARILRKKHNIEAWVYHDHHESIVTVGSFDQIGNKLRDGTIDLLPEVARYIEMFGPTKQSLGGQNGVALAGVQPKAIENGKFVFDIAPLPVLVPRKSIATDYLSGP